MLTGQMQLAVGRCAGQGGRMVEIADIEDRDSLWGWLEDQPREVSVWIAHRSAMRLLPLWWDFVQRPADAKKGDLTALPVLRS